MNRIAAALFVVFTGSSVALLIHRPDPPSDPGPAASIEPSPAPQVTIVHTVAGRIVPPTGYRRIPCHNRSFPGWLRTLPLKEGRPPVRLFDGRLKSNQDAHAAVIDMDTGSRDLQQCADAVIRLRAEYLYEEKRFADIRFKATCGDPMELSQWRKGERPFVQGNRLVWKMTRPPDESRSSFRAYLDSVFTYAGTLSLNKELRPRAWTEMEAGDAFIQGGQPGHAVIVLDVAVHDAGRGKVFLLAQSYMPAQEIHILKNPGNPAISPWYGASGQDRLVTPEWTFGWGDLKRFE